MKTRDFISQAWNGETRRTSCASVFYSGGAVYSYGYHYPLLFNLNGKTLRNVRGYSSTTGRHIAWSRDVDAIDVVVPRGFRLNGSDDDLMAQIITSQRAHVAQLAENLQAKKRQDTQVYKWLEYDYLRAADNLKQLVA